MEGENMDPRYKYRYIEGPYRGTYNKKAHRIFLATLLLFLVCAVAILFIRHVVSSQDPDVYVVQKGDTLWGIVKKIYGERYDARVMVYRMMKLNGLTEKDIGRLKPGMRLLLPVVVD